MHTLTHLTDITLVVTVALGCGLLLEKFKQPAVLGYILTGVLLGPSMFAYIQNKEVVSILADLGVLLLLFLVGMELSLRSFKRVWMLTSTATIFQIFGGLIFAFFFHLCTQCSWPFAVLLGLIISLSSTAVSVKMLENTGELKSDAGRLTLGILVAQDLAIIPIMIVLRSFQHEFEWQSFTLKIVFSIGFMALLVRYLGRRQRVHIPFAQIFVNSHDLLPLVGLALCLGFATISGFLGLSAAYGAFLAGLILGNSGERALMLQTMTPIYSVFMMVFFLSIGLLLDLWFIFDNLFRICVLLVMITFGKTIFNVAILYFLRCPWPQAFLTGVVLAQIGEFSFMLTSLGEETGIINDHQKQLIITLTALSLSLGPFWLFVARRLHEYPITSSTSMMHVLRSIYGKTTTSRLSYYFRNFRFNGRKK